MANSDLVKIVKFNFPDDVHTYFTEASSAFLYVYEYKTYIVYMQTNLTAMANRFNRMEYY